MEYLTLIIIGVVCITIVLTVILTLSNFKSKPPIPPIVNKNDVDILFNTSDIGNNINFTVINNPVSVKSLLKVETFTINWGDGTVETYTYETDNKEVSHEYIDDGEYTINIVDNYTGLSLTGGQYNGNLACTKVTINDNININLLDTNSEFLDNGILNLDKLYPTLQQLGIGNNNFLNDNLEETLLNFPQLIILDISSKNLTDFNTQGFEKLQELNCANNEGIELLDLSNLTNLTTLNLEGLTNLTTLNLEGLTNLTTLNLEGLTNLTTLNTEGLTNLTISGLTSLTSLQSIDTSILTSITSLDLSGLTSITSLDLSNLSDIISLNIERCTGITTLNLSNLNNLESLFLSNSGILNVVNLLGQLPNKTKLKQLTCDGVNITGIFNVTAFTNLVSLSCNNNSGLTRVTTTNLTKLVQLNCNIGNPNLSAIFGFNTNITALNLNGLTGLKNLYLNDSPITSINFGNALNIEFLSFTNTQLTDFSFISILTKLIELEINNMNISNLNVIGLTRLNRILLNGCNFNTPSANTLAGQLISNNVLANGTLDLRNQTSGPISILNPSNLYTLDNAPKNWNVIV